MIYPSIATCNVKECAWYSYGKSIDDAELAWTAHVAAEHYDIRRGAITNKAFEAFAAAVEKDAGQTNRIIGSMSRRELEDLRAVALALAEITAARVAIYGGHLTKTPEN